MTPEGDAAFGRVLLKLSGEALMGERDYGQDPGRITAIAKALATVHDQGVQVAIVVGGGNILRGTQEAARGMDRATADYAGMLATVLNALAISGRARAARRPHARAVGHQRRRRWPSRTSAAARSATSRRAAS